MMWLIWQAICVEYVYLYANANAWGKWYGRFMPPPPSNMVIQNSQYYDELSRVNRSVRERIAYQETASLVLMNRVQYLVNMADKGEGVTFPDGDIWYKEPSNDYQD